MLDASETIYAVVLNEMRRDIKYTTDTKDDINIYTRSFIIIRTENVYLI